MISLEWQGWKGLAETLAREDFEAIRAIGEHAVSRLHGFGILVRAAFLPLLDAHILVLPGILASRHDRVAMPFATDAAEPSAHSYPPSGRRRTADPWGMDRRAGAAARKRTSAGERYNLVKVLRPCGQVTPAGFAPAQGTVRSEERDERVAHLVERSFALQRPSQHAHQRRFALFVIPAQCQDEQHLERQQAAQEQYRRDDQQQRRKRKRHLGIHGSPPVFGIPVRRPPSPQAGIPKRSARVTRC
ncbi:hypothetical protein QYE77_08330 [Thermanaerothrix sp. 4228-RoL]|uniref:Uncharacterized protein n=1 Tax=Thermanaerothrix solaris TaxID=3058434 RepID=A0ABU3NN67_9CHLR|nr:hypothetical protein [Thermanaerothrix sp. 4228-RoL]MDT8898272.1 hypothetical protein [Thermanaerothrix sp. 4228-RoL]